MPDPCPLNETALRKAREEVVHGYEVDVVLPDEEADRILVSTYLREAGFEVESQYKTLSADRRHNGDPEQRLAGQWQAVPVDQVEEEE